MTNSLSLSHTGDVKNLDPRVRDRLWQVAPISLVVFVRLLIGITGEAGIAGIMGMFGDEALLVLGWILGQMLTELDHVFYTSVCNPQELTCQRIKKEIEAKNWKNAWGLLQSTKEERTKLPISNMLTVAVILGMGIWVISSNTNYLAMGVILGMTFRLFADALTEKNYKKWYWIFAREINETEHRGFLVAWIIVLVWETLKVVTI